MKALNLHPKAWRFVVIASAAGLVCATGIARAADTPTTVPVQAAAPAPVDVADVLSGGTDVLGADALFATSPPAVDASVTISPQDVTGQPFARALQITAGESGAGGGGRRFAPQFAATTIAPIAAGDTLLLSLSLRGSAAKGGGPARLNVSLGPVPPTTPPATPPAPGAFRRGFPAFRQTFTTDVNPDMWSRVEIPVRMAQSYDQGSARLGFSVAASQTVEIGGLSLMDLGANRDLDLILTRLAERIPTRTVTISVNAADKRQRMVGFGGDFANERFGQAEPNDAVGTYVLNTLGAVSARLAIPLDKWAATPGTYDDSGGCHASMILMQEMNQRRIPVVLSIWEAPNYMVEDPSRRQQRVIAAGQYGACIDAIAQFLVTARDKYGATAEYLSFNEADGGWDIKFTTDQIAAFMKQAAPRFAALGIHTKWLVGDTSNGQPLVSYVRPLLEDASLAPLLGPISFHSWDAMRASDADYTAIADLGKEFHKPVWCLEMGYDAQIYQARPPVWDTFDNALKLSQDYAKTLHFAGASIVDYWQYQRDYQLAGGPDGDQPYPALRVLQQFIKALPRDAQVVESVSSESSIVPVAATGPHDGESSLVVVNPSGAATATVTGLAPGHRFTEFRSTAGGQNIRFGGDMRTNDSGQTTLDLPARSIVSIIER